MDAGYWILGTGTPVPHWPRLDMPSVMLHSIFIIGASAQFVIRHLMSLT
jgi:hypothetical protein